MWTSVSPCQQSQRAGARLKPAGGGGGGVSSAAHDVHERGNARGQQQHDEVDAVETAEVSRRKLNFKGKFDSRTSYFSFKSMDPGGFNTGFIGSTCTASPRVHASGSVTSPLRSAASTAATATA